MNTALQTATVKTVVAKYVDQRDVVIADLKAALEQILMPDVFHVAVNRIELSSEPVQTVIGDIYEIARVALAKAEA
ncbi:hypothetical protein [Rhizobiales bacterium 3FA27D7]|uniref:hypothetical protein n=1 Tax=Mesorhizobium sp. 2RAF21 TaxID=3232995 RepID=UPI0010F8229B